jgi:hypothetical protein
MVEIGDDCAEHPEAPKFLLTWRRSWRSSHQEKPSNIGWRCPGSDAVFCFGVEPFTMKSCFAILEEGGGGLATVAVLERLSAQGACDTPPQQLAP